MTRRVFVLGLDAFSPQLCFEKFKGEMPNLSRLMEQSAWGKSNSSIPPLSCTAWVSFAKGRNPGASGIQGFTTRKNFSYTNIFVANSTVIEKERIWDILAKAGKKCIAVNVPVTYPPHDINGIMVSGFLTPDEDRDYTYPKEIKEEINKIAQGYVIDVKGVRSKEKEALLKELLESEEKRFKVAKEFIQKKEWDFFIFVVMGTDRIHHAFWADMDETHPEHDPKTKFENAIRDYYVFIDKKIGEVAKLLEKDDVLLVMSDHGSRDMHGFFNVNEWLIKEGYLKLKSYPKEATVFPELDFDWKNTKVFSTGNYMARIFLNLKGREKEGIVEESEYEMLRNEIKERIMKARDENGKPMQNMVFKREEAYAGKYVEMQPDLIAYFDDLKWGTNPMVGSGKIFSHKTDWGKNSANHYRKGMWVLHNAGLKEGKHKDIELIDLMPTVLKLLGTEIPKEVEGKAIV